MTRPLTTGPARVLGLYRGLIGFEVQALTAYRSRLILDSLGWVVPVAFLALWHGAASAGPVDGISAAQFTTYYAVLLATTSIQVSSILSFELAPKVHSGELSALLVRPAHPIHPLVAKGVAEIGYRLLPLLIVVPLLIGLAGGTVSDDPMQWLLAVVVCLLGSVADGYLGAMMGSVALWLTRSSGIRGLLFGMSWLLGGLVAPIALYPGNLPELLRHQPIWYSIGAPGEAMSGISVLSPWMLVEAVAWIVLLHLTFRSVWRRGMRRYEAVGT